MLPCHDAGRHGLQRASLFLLSISLRVRSEGESGRDGHETKDVMTKNPITVESDLLLMDARKVMKEIISDASCGRKRQTGGHCYKTGSR